MKDLGFAGFKVLYPINSKDKNDEIVSMLGASYFRVIGAGQVYGFLRAVWQLIPRCHQVKNFHVFASSGSNVQKPTDKRLTIYALLDSPVRPALIAS